MENLFLFLLFFDSCSAVKHSLAFFSTASTGIPDLPQFTAALNIDGMQAGSCNSNKDVQINRDAAKRLLKDHPGVRKEYSKMCFQIQPERMAARLESLLKLFNQSGGVHVLQSIEGCEWDENTGKVEGFLLYGYDGEDLVSLDLEKMTWISLKPQGDIVKQMWDNDKERIRYNENYMTVVYPDWLKKYLSYENIYTIQTAPPSVSLLHQSPSSPVSCHATGFYPDRAQMFWRKDGEKIHEDMVQGEILPNQDGTFQMRVDLNISSVKKEDWSRYECMFQLYGMGKDIITKLKETGISIQKTWIRTPNEFPAAAVIGLVVVMLLLLAVTIIVITVIMNKNRGFTPTRTTDPTPSREESLENTSQPQIPQHTKTEAGLPEGPYTETQEEQHSICSPVQ